MRSARWLLAFHLLPLGALAQNQLPAPYQPPAALHPPAPMERADPGPLPNAPQPAPSPAQIRANLEWERLAGQTHYLRPEVRIQAEGDALRCDVDKVTPDEIFCTEHRASNGPFLSLLHPKEQYHIPRREIRNVRVGGRELSTLLGAGIGIGLGVGLGSIKDASREEGGQAIFALLLGGLGGLIGHALPFAGHPIYQQP